MCKEEGCDREPEKYRKGWCSSCHYRWRTYGDPRGGSKPPLGEALAYFHAHLGEEGPGCLIWPYSRNEASYGMVTLNGRRQSVSRLACEHQWGPPPSPGMDAAHLPIVCHKRLCWRGVHLRWATRRENVADMELDKTTLRGEGRWTSILTEAQVLEILTRFTGRGCGVTQRELAEEYGTTVPNISSIVTRKSWTHLTIPGRN